MLSSSNDSNKICFIFLSADFCQVQSAYADQEERSEGLWNKEIDRGSVLTWRHLSDSGGHRHQRHQCVGDSGGKAPPDEVRVGLAVGAACWYAMTQV